MKWDDSWREELKRTNECCYERLCECRNTKADIKRIAKIMYQYNYEYASAEECLDRTLEWIGIWNSQYDLVDSIVSSEYYKILWEIEK